MEEAKAQLSTLIKRAASDKQRVILTCNGEPVAAIVPIEDLKLLEEIEDRKDVQDARAVILEVEREGTVSWEQIKTESSLQF